MVTTISMVWRRQKEMTQFFCPDESHRTKVNWTIYLRIVSARRQTLHSMKCATASMMWNSIISTMHMTIFLKMIYRCFRRITTQNRTISRTMWLKIWIISSSRIVRCQMRRSYVFIWRKMMLRHKPASIVWPSVYIVFFYSIILSVGVDVVWNYVPMKLLMNERW